MCGITGIRSYDKIIEKEFLQGMTDVLRHLYILRTDSSVNYSASATEAKSQSRLSYSLIYDHSRKHPESPWSLGAMYRGYAGMETRIEADVTAFVPVQGVLVSMPSYTPSEWALMGTYSLASWWTFSGEIARVEWKIGRAHV